MNPIYTLIAIPVLGALNLILAVCADKLYHQGYSKHVATEPMRTKNAIWTKQVGRWLAITLALFVGPAFLISQGYGNGEGFPMMSGYVIGYLAFLAGHSLFSVILFKYVKDNPDSVEGHVTFKYGLTEMSVITFIAQALLFVTLLTIFYPCMFMYGVILALSVLLFTVFFSKKPLAFNP